MELWIMNQNKSVLSKINEVSISDENDGKYYILNEDNLILGVYAEEKRCIEILDEIADKIKPYHNNNDVQINSSGYYEMPEE